MDSQSFTMANNGDMNILGLTDILMESASVSSSGENSEERREQQQQSQSLNIPAKKWEYFEIGDHPKAISDKKLVQLKYKFQRSNTEPAAVAEGDLEGSMIRDK